MHDVTRLVAVEQSNGTLASFMAAKILWFSKSETPHLCLKTKRQLPHSYFVYLGSMASIALMEWNVPWLIHKCFDPWPTPMIAETSSSRKGGKNSHSAHRAVLG